MDYLSSFEALCKEGMLYALLDSPYGDQFPSAFSVAFLFMRVLR